jgi:NAD(P)-dependent dehydrogenase (short-subunit alcohol dehydrogenase family)
MSSNFPPPTVMPCHVVYLVLSFDHVDTNSFPVNCYDLDGQQIDKRPSQTWVKQLHEVSTVELAEVHIVNALAPFILNSKLKPLMMRSKEGAFIINVSSMEGKFRAFKDVTHPHTNMAKAALNMMTHTVAKDLAHDRIFINSVDTGMYYHSV